MRKALLLLLALSTTCIPNLHAKTTTTVAPQPKVPLALPPGESEYPLIVTKRNLLQSRFSVIQSKLYADPEKAPDSAHQDLEKLNKEVAEFQQAYLAFEENRSSFWSNPSYWGKYWDRSGTGSARYLAEKLSAQIQKVRGMKLDGVAPFKREDLNATQKMLDAIREGLSIDHEIGVAANVLK